MGWRVRVIQGSMSDSEQTNKLLREFKKLGVPYQVSVASCHRNIGDDPDELGPFIEEIDEELIAFIGGMSLAAPGIIRSWLISISRHAKIVFGIPLDAAARSAIEDLPMGCPVITCGLNTVSVTHSIINSALAIAHMICVAGDIVDDVKLLKWYDDNKENKPLRRTVMLDEKGLITIEAKK